jgi:hypothetical protein
MVPYRRHPVERAIIYAGILGNLPREDINALLAAITLDSICPKPLPEASYDMLRDFYYSDWMKSGNFSLDAGPPNAFGESIYHPRPMGNLVE